MKAQGELVGLFLVLEGAVMSPTAVAGVGAREVQHAWTGFSSSARSIEQRRPRNKRLHVQVASVCREEFGHWHE